LIKFTWKIQKSLGNTSSCDKEEKLTVFVTNYRFQT